MVTTLELPATAQVANQAQSAYQSFRYEVRHPENHKQLVRFLCVGASGYFVNLATFALCIHVFGVGDTLSLVIAFLVGSSNNFVWNRHWTFGAREEHPFRQGVRFFAVSTLVFFFATGIYTLLVHVAGIDQKVLSDGIAWVIATPLSFVVQKLWSFRA
jgi:putative flippase GtrA